MTRPNFEFSAQHNRILSRLRLPKEGALRYIRARVMKMTIIPSVPIQFGRHFTADVFVIIYIKKKTITSATGDREGTDTRRKRPPDPFSPRPLPSHRTKKKTIAVHPPSTYHTPPSPPEVKYGVKTHTAIVATSVFDFGTSHIYKTTMSWEVALQT